MLYSLRGYLGRQLVDGTRLLMGFHTMLTIIHFITWAVAYHGTGGGGPGLYGVQVRAHELSNRLTE